MSASRSQSEVFSASVVDIEASALVTMSGELDLFTSPVLAREMNSAIDRGARSLVLDAAELAFMDAAGLGVVIAASERLATDGGTLSIRAASVTLRRLLDLTGFIHLAEPVVTDAPEHLGAEQEDEENVDPLGAAMTFGRIVAAVPVANDLVDGALRLVVALAQATVGGADGVSISLRRQGHLSTVAASDETISAMDADQYATGEGPCVSASVDGHWFHVESLDAEDRWPDFVPRARTLGINSILSTPLTASGRPIGALNIYSRESAAFAPADQELAAVFAAEASTILEESGVDVTASQLAERMQRALQSRQDIAIAQGIIMGRDGVNRDDAYRALRRASASSDVPLADIARDFVHAVRIPAAPDETARR